MCGVVCCNNNHIPVISGNGCRVTACKLRKRRSAHGGGDKRLCHVVKYPHRDAVWNASSAFIVENAPGNVMGGWLVHRRREHQKECKGKQSNKVRRFPCPVIALRAHFSSA